MAPFGSLQDVSRTSLNQCGDNAVKPRVKRPNVFGRKCHIALDDFCAAVKRSAKPFTAGPNRPVGETGESRKWTLSASLISVRFNHRWHLSTTRLAMDLLIAWAVILVAHKARSVALHSLLKAAGFGFD